MIFPILIFMFYFCLLFIFIYSESGHHDGSNTLKVSHYDISHPDENPMFALNQVAPR